ncbi:hypothetical protein [Hymenobacter sp. BRD67]|uniref:hypothetical protein n=1 Tax=Hymenobacter sp. BRD67 TaxID=2675877 RepID=UPI0015648FDA|nr:hypothetical protein [Hymenobacter sp. BRD67]QKG53142.1 hypothetical protein GKZ67_11710 [Hymenobacter sp. BRD67]
MRFFYLFIVCWTLAHTTVAQPIKHKSDCYVLADSITRHPAIINLVESDKIAIKELSGKKHFLHAGSIAWFQSKGHRYYTLNNFEVKPGNADSRVRYGFAELVDSGQVTLLRYDYSKAKFMVIGGSGMLLPGVGPGMASLYLLRLAASPQQVTVVPSDGLLGNGPRFRAALQPYLANRPDLLTLLSDKKFNIQDLPDIVRAINTNQAYTKSFLPVGGY